MNDWTVPTDSELDQAMALVARPESRVYFFDRLENPKWVPALAAHGVFDDPPATVEADEPGYVRFPPWPEGRYLARMAPVMPDAVAEVFAALQPSANPAITSTLLEGVLALPDRQFRQLAHKAVDWISASETAEFSSWFTDKAAIVIVRLVTSGKVRQGLKAAKSLLWVERHSPEYNVPDFPDLPLESEPVGRFSDWEYEQVIKKILPGLVNSAGLKGVKLFSSLLSAAVRFSMWEEKPLADSDGGACFWRPAVEDHPQNSGDGVRHILVAAARDAAVRWAQVSAEALQAVVQTLEGGSVLHRRIALHVLSVVPGGEEMAAERIADRGVFDDYRLKHEYAGLLRSRLGEAPPAIRRTFLDWVLAGPDLDRFRRNREARFGSAPSPEDEAAYSEFWQRDWLSIVEDHLAGDEVVWYQELVAERGKAEHPDFVAWATVTSGPVVPLTAEEMSLMPPGEVVEFLDSWQPDDSSDWSPERSVAAFGSAFESAVSERAADFAAVANRIETLEPTYVRSFLSGLTAAARAGAPIPWDKPIRLMAAVLGHPIESEEAMPYSDRDPGWSNTRREIASLIKEGAADRENCFPFELRQAVWSILDPLTRDPNPSPAHEAESIGGSMDTFTLSLNVNRGQAMSTVVSYALWCRRELEAHGADVSEGFDLIPEVRAVLDEHLEPDSEPSLAVRAVYGKWLPWLILLDERWVVANISRMLPSAPELGDLRDAAWDAYISWCPPYDNVYEILQHEYEAAVERVPSGRTAGFANKQPTDAKLGEHLAAFFWRGLLEHSLLERWFELADDSLAAQVMDFVGRALQNTEGDLEPEVRQRIRRLWDSRLQVVGSKPDSHRCEANAFALTLASAKLDDDWSFESLEAILQHGSSVRLASFAMDRLVEIAETRPAEATRCARLILENPTNNWNHRYWREPATTIMRATSHAIDLETRENRRAIADYYVKRGYYDFRALVTSQP